ncbi:MAG TPA: hypothetical protein VNC78_10415 [Actinomycetota bacterium]|nr:hypothetical protein [Actinomycetota bacterium]
MKKLRAMWQSTWEDSDRRIRLGRLLGLIFITAGFIVIGKAWDGAASKNFATAQMPYLLSGGFMGLGLIVTGSTLLLLSTVRSERAILTSKFDEMSTLLSRNLARLGYSGNGNGSAAGDETQVIAGATVYHLPDCKILQGKKGLMSVTLEQAANEGLKACRVCEPPKLPESKTKEASVN